MKHIGNTDRNGLNEQNTHTHTHTNTHQTLRERYTLERVSMKINDTSPFLKQPHLFYQPPPLFYGKSLNAPFFWKFWKLNPSSFIKGGGSNHALAFSIWKINIHWLKNCCYTFVRSRQFWLPKIRCFWFSVKVQPQYTDFALK